MGLLPVCAMVLLVVLGVFRLAVGTEQPEEWLQDARIEAKQDGYQMMSSPELKTLYDSGKKFRILDVRPEYEYRNGHLPLAENLEFDLGDKLELNKDKQTAFLKLLGADKEELIVIYCRSFA